MILVGNQRGGGRNLAQHLMKDDNEKVVVHELHGFASDDLHSAFQESHAISRGTRCKQHLYSLSLNPPKEADPTPELLVDSVNRAEERLGLQGQPRAIVFHEKIGLDGQVRRHAHAVWCRIDIETMTAKQLSYDHTKLNTLGRELYIEHDWKMPRGFVRHEERNPRNYSLAEWQQAKRAKKNPGKLKGMFQECWSVSDSQAAFSHALKARGYILARGDRRGVVAVDHQDEAYSIRQYVGVKSSRVQDRIKDMNSLPDVISARNQAASLVRDRLAELKAQQAQRAKAQLSRLAEERRRRQRAQSEYTRQLVDKQRARAATEQQERKTRIRTGWRGLMDRITGKRKRIEAENRIAAKAALRRDGAERTAVSAFQKSARQQVLENARAAKVQHKAVLDELRSDMKRLESIRPPVPDKMYEPENPARKKYVKEQKREASKTKRGRTPTRERKKRRPNDPGYSRGGPSPGF